MAMTSMFVVVAVVMIVVVLLYFVCLFVCLLVGWLVGWLVGLLVRWFVRLFVWRVKSLHRFLSEATTLAQDPLFQKVPNYKKTTAS